ncbi:HNH endonuclease signature motif containing protein, partial [Arthrobacter sp. 4R501]|uniref:HNH endonuclease signature motif containing protein n=1 Tax=Arthrobacter sp. 4R501 TaxID=2058886 RepID=UPI0011B05CCA
WNRTTSAARALQGPHEDRNLSQLRAYTVATWLLGNNIAGAGTGVMTNVTGGSGEPGMAVGGGIPSPRAQVLVTVPVFSLLGLTDEPAMLDGYGPIPPSMARQLIADGAESFHRVLIDPRDGAPLEIGRTSYRVTKAQRQWLRLRDGRCPFPGCSNHSLDNEADHLLAWAHGGRTGIRNLGQPCRKHHRLRHITGWKPTTATKNEPPGWISPTGRHYKSEHPDWEPPHWPKLWPNDPVSEPQPSGLHLPSNELPDCGLPSDDIVPDDALPDGPVPEDPYPSWDFTAHSTVRPPAPSDASAK